jgi:1-acyl-sn-glycerol-3-phosphate acyltransferase
MANNGFKTFLNDFIIEPITNLTYAGRQVLKKMGILTAIDEFIFTKIEDPLYYWWFKKDYQFEVFNDEVIPKEGAAIFASNHQSLLDPLVSGLAIVHRSKRIPHQLAKADLGVDSLLGNFVRMNQSIFIRRGESDDSAFDKCIEVLNDGRLLISFPEGTFGPGNGKMLPFHSGVIRMAFTANVPIIPMATFGIDQIFGKGMKMPKSKGTLKVKFGEPLTLEKLMKKKDGATPTYEEYKKATKKLQRIVQKLWTDLWMENETAKKEAAKKKASKNES